MNDSKTCKTCQQPLLHKIVASEFCSKSCYLKHYYNSHKPQTNNPPKKCNCCGTELAENSRPNAKFCNKTCQQIFLTNKKITQSQEKYKNSDKSEYIICDICGFHSPSLYVHFRYNHPDIDISNYSSTQMMCEKERIHRSNKIKGDKNPAYQHNGKFSSLSKNFVKYQHLTEEEIENNVNGVIEKISISNKENGNNSTTIQYWLNQGYSLEESTELLSERQTTFSKEICIQKYGEVEGIKKWVERQERWQSSLNNKTQEEIEKINQKKSTGRMNQLFNKDPEVKNIPGTLYFVKIFNDEISFFKVGITSKNVSVRFKELTRNNLQYQLLKEWTDMTFYECYKEEQKLLKEFENHRININYNGFTTTEAFDKNILLMNLNE